MWLHFVTIQFVYCTMKMEADLIHLLDVMYSAVM